MKAARRVRTRARRLRPRPPAGRGVHGNPPGSLPWMVALLAALAIAPSATAFEFLDAARSAGVEFTHTGGGPDPWFPEMMGSGACWFDLDGDGYDDLFLVNGAYADEALQALFRPTGRLYLNLGDGTFSDATAGSGLDFEGYGNGCAAADHDADGCTDIYVTGYDLSRLLRSRCDGTFEDVTAAAGVVNRDCPDEPCWGHSGAWADYDDDGDLDLYVGNYVKLVPQPFRLNAPGPYEGAPNALYRNNGDGTFTDVAAAAGVRGLANKDCCKTLAVGWQDYDLDGDPDLLVANDEVPQQLYRNNGDGTFTDVAREFGVDWTRGGMGVAWGDIDRDGCPEALIAFYAFEAEGLAWNGCDGTMRDESEPFGSHGLHEHEKLVRWSNALWDYDNDGWLDYLVVTGDVYYWSQGQMDQPPILYRNMLGDPDHGRTFRNVSAEVGEAFRAQRNARGAAFGDYDVDGRLDVVVVANYNETALLLRGSGEDVGAWLEIDLLDEASPNRGAIGARVTVTAGGASQTRERVAGSGFESTSAPRLHFGLGAAAVADRVRVEWPDGALEEWTDLAAGNLYRLERGNARAVDDALPPRTSAAVEGARAASGWYHDPVRVSLSAVDRGAGVVSGVASTLYALGEPPSRRYESPLDLADGRHELRSRSTDASGNVEPVRTLRVDVDTVAPSTAHAVDPPPFASGRFAPGALVTLTANDATSGVAATYWRLRAGDDFRRYEGPFPLPDDDVTLAYYSTDAAGHVEPLRELPLLVDGREPVTMARVEGTAGDDGWWRSDVTVRLEAVDPRGGPVRTLHSLDGGDEGPYAGPIQVSGDGIHTLRHRSVDVAGVSGKTTEETIRIDTVSPVSEDDFDEREGDSGWRTRLVLRMTGTDATSGVRELRYRLDGGPPVPVAGSATVPDGRWILATSARDVAGNEEAPRERAVLLDATPPRTTARADGPRGLEGWWVGNVTVALAASDATSGVASTRRSLDDAPWEAGGGPFPVTGEGIHRVRFASRDVAGNEEPERLLEVGVDWSAPETPLVAEGRRGDLGWFTSPVTVTLDARDAISGVERTEAERNGVAGTPVHEVGEGVHVYRYRSSDRAGNVEAWRERVVPVDVTPPATSLTYEGGPRHETSGATFVTSEARIRVAATDATSGVREVYYRIDDGPTTRADAAFHLLGEDGPRRIEHWAVDVAGNEEPHRVSLVVLDETPPEVAIERPAPGSVNVGTRLVALLAGAEDAPAVMVGDEAVADARSRDAGAGVARVRLLLDGRLLAEAAGGGELAAAWRVEPGDAGMHVLEVEAVDHLGHSSVVRNDVLVVPGPTSVFEARARDPAGAGDPSLAPRGVRAVNAGR